MNKKDIHDLLNKCDNCKLYECIGCELTYTEIQNIKNYVEQLEEKTKQMGKGQQTLIRSRRKWKNRYYKERNKFREMNKAFEEACELYENNEIYDAEEVLNIFIDCYAEGRII